MRRWAFFLLCAALVLVQVNLFRMLSWTHRPQLTPSLILPVVLFVGVHDFSVVRGAAISFALGYATDVIGIAPVGLYTGTFVALFLLARAAGLQLGGQPPWTQALVTLVFSAVHSGMLLVPLVIRLPDGWVPRHLVHFVLPHSLTTAVLSPLVFALVQRAAAVSSPPAARAGLRLF